jgi:hypothetical protein
MKRIVLSTGEELNAYLAMSDFGETFFISEDEDRTIDMYGVKEIKGEDATLSQVIDDTLNHTNLEKLFELIKAADTFNVKEESQKSIYMTIQTIGLLRSLVKDVITQAYVNNSTASIGGVKAYWDENKIRIKFESYV